MNTHSKYKINGREGQGDSYEVLFWRRGVRKTWTTVLKQKVGRRRYVRICPVGSPKKTGPQAGQRQRPKVMAGWRHGGRKGAQCQGQTTRTRQTKQKTQISRYNEGSEQVHQTGPQWQHDKTTAMQTPPVRHRSWPLFSQHRLGSGTATQAHPGRPPLKQN